MRNRLVLVLVLVLVSINSIVIAPCSFCLSVSFAHYLFLFAFSKRAMRSVYMWLRACMPGYRSYRRCIHHTVQCVCAHITTLLHSTVSTLVYIHVRCSFESRLSWFLLSLFSSLLLLFIFYLYVIVAAASYFIKNIRSCTRTMHIRICVCSVRFIVVVTNIRLYRRRRHHHRCSSHLHSKIHNSDRNEKLIENRVTAVTRLNPEHFVSSQQSQFWSRKWK